MAVYNRIPERFTNLDIRDTLNAYGGSVGDNSLNYFSAAARINMWSKRKPVKRNIMFNTEDPNWFRADSGSYRTIHYHSSLRTYPCLRQCHCCEVDAEIT